MIHKLQLCLNAAIGFLSLSFAWPSPAFTQQTIGALSRGFSVEAPMPPSIGTVPRPPNTCMSRTEQLRLTPFRLHDPMVQTDALQMLIIQGWQVEGGIVWRPNNVSLAVADMTITAPSRTMALRSYPTDYFCYADHLVAMFPVGTNYLGMELRSPIESVADYVRVVVLPRYLKQRSVRITSVQPLPQVASDVAAVIREPGMQKTVSAARVRVEYNTPDGTSMEEDIYCTLWCGTSPLSPGFTQWGSERCYSFAAPRGQLDQNAKLFQTMVASIQFSPQWLYKYDQVRQLFLQRLARGIKNAGLLSQYLTQINGEINDVIISGYEQRQKTMDKINRKFSNYVRGVQDYRVPGSTDIAVLPSGYRDVWLNESGEYILSDIPGLDPNLQSNKRWQRLTPVP